LRSDPIRNVNRMSFFIEQILTSFSIRIRPKKCLTFSGGPCHSMSCVARHNGDFVKTSADTFPSNRRLARAIWGAISSIAMRHLKALTDTHALSIGAGDLQLLDGRWYVTHGGLLRISERRRCFGIRTIAEKELSDPTANRWVFKATVYKSPGSKGFVGYGDADPSNVSSLVHGCEMRVAETRAVNRALRKAYGIGLCSVEELGWAPRVADSKPSGPARPSTVVNNGHSNGHSNGHHNGQQPRLRDRLCLLIRQHGLDATLVKAYAADYCGTAALRDATRDQIEAFINHLADRAAKDREGLLCHLNSYPKPQEAHP
jgi:hypothetical protein